MAELPLTLPPPPQEEHAPVPEQAEIFTKIKSDLPYARHPYILIDVSGSTGSIFIDKTDTKEHEFMFAEQISHEGNYDHVNLITWSTMGDSHGLCTLLQLRQIGQSTKSSGGTQLISGLEMHQ